MIVAGNIAGIQRFITAVPHIGRGQARRLRARSVYAQLLSEAAAIRCMQTLQWPIHGSVVLSAAGHFVLRGTASGDSVSKLIELEAELGLWTLTRLNGEIRISLGWSDDESLSEFRQLESARKRLFASDAAPFRAAVTDADGWKTQRLVLDPLDTPCPLCRSHRADHTEVDPHTHAPLTLCRNCFQMGRFGGQLAGRGHSDWLKFTIADPADNTQLQMVGLSAAIDTAFPRTNTVALTSSNYDVQALPPMLRDRWIDRKLARYVPTNPDRSVQSFQQIADNSVAWLKTTGMGARRLAVFKADGDRMGEYWQRILGQRDIAAYAAASRRFDDFASGHLNELLERSVTTGDYATYRTIYTVYSGGDDLLFVGPWDVVLDFAGTVREKFHQLFGPEGLTLSAGIAIIHPGKPIRRSVEMAEELLLTAKSVPAEGFSEPGDQVAALDTVWKWQDHESVIRAGKYWSQLCLDKIVERGWLYSLRELNESRRGRRKPSQRDAPCTSMLAPARLQWLGDRWQRNRRPRPARQHAASGIDPLRQQLEMLYEQFGSPQTAEYIHFSAVMEYALLATRAREREEEEIA